MFYKEIWEQAWPGSAFLEHLEAQGLKISANHGGGKGEGELQDVTSLPKKTLDTSLKGSIFTLQSKTYVSICLMRYVKHKFNDLVFSGLI